MERSSQAFSHKGGGCRSLCYVGCTTKPISFVLLSHPDCTKEEIDNYIKKRFGSVGTPENWGAVEITKTNRKVWWNCQNSD